METTLKADIADRYNKMQVQIFAVTWGAYAGLYFTRVSAAVAKIGLSQDAASGGLGFNNKDFAYVDFSFLIAYTLGQFFWGPMSDRYGTRKIVLIGMGLAIASAVISGISDSLAVLIGFASLQGFAQASGWGPLCKTMSAWFEMKQRGSIMGLWSTNYAVGGCAATAFAGMMASPYFFDSWRGAFFAPAAVLSIVMFLFFIFQRNSPEECGLPPANRSISRLGDVNNNSRNEPVGVISSIIQVLTNKIAMVFGLAYFCIKPTRYAILFWGPKFVYETHGTSVGESSLICSMFEFSGPIGAFLAGYLSDRMFHTRRAPICVIFLIFLSLSLFFFHPLTSLASVGHTFLYMLLFAIGIFTFGPDTLLSGAAAMDCGTQKGAGTLTGFVNGCGSISAIAGGSLPGIIAIYYGWDGVFFALGLASTFAALLLATQWNTKPKYI